MCPHKCIRLNTVTKTSSSDSGRKEGVWYCNLGNLQNTHWLDEGHWLNEKNRVFPGRTAPSSWRGSRVAAIQATSMSRKGFERIREHFLNLDSGQEDRSRISQYDKILWILQIPVKIHLQKLSLWNSDYECLKIELQNMKLSIVYNKIGKIA